MDSDSAGTKDFAWFIFIALGRDVVEFLVCAALNDPVSVLFVLVVIN